MDARLTSLANGLGNFLLSILILCFNGPRLLVPSTGTNVPLRDQEIHSKVLPHVHATATMEKLENGRRLTLQLEFDGSRAHTEDEAE
jgi:hypothetical protein